MLMHLYTYIHMYVCVCVLRRLLSSLREKVDQNKCGQQARLTNIKKVIQVFGN